LWFFHHMVMLSSFAFGFRRRSFLTRQSIVDKEGRLRSAFREVHNWTWNFDRNRKQKCDKLRFTIWNDRRLLWDCATVHYAVIKCLMNGLV
jgi:hypothetical protein